MASLSVGGSSVKICSGAVPRSSRSTRSKTVCSGVNRRDSLSLAAAAVAAVLSNNSAKVDTFFCFALPGARCLVCVCLRSDSEGLKPRTDPNWV